MLYVKDVREPLERGHIIYCSSAKALISIIKDSPLSLGYCSLGLIEVDTAAIIHKMYGNVLVGLTVAEFCGASEAVICRRNGHKTDI